MKAPPAHKQPTRPPQTLAEALLKDKQEKSRADAWLEFQLNKIGYYKRNKK